MRRLVDSLQPDVEDEVRVGGDGAGETSVGWGVSSCSKTLSLSDSRRKEGLLVSVGVIRGDIQGSLLADLHADNTLVPAANDATDTDGGAEIGLAD